MSKRFVAALAFVLLLILAVFLYRGCRLGDVGLPGEEAAAAQVFLVDVPREALPEVPEATLLPFAGLRSGSLACNEGPERAGERSPAISE